MERKWIILVVVLCAIGLFPLTKLGSTLYDLLFNTKPYIIRDLPSDITTGDYITKEDNYFITLKITKEPENIIDGEALIDGKSLKFYLKVDRNVEYAEIYASNTDELIGVCNYKVNTTCLILTQYDFDVYKDDSLPLAYEDKFFSQFGENQLIFTNT